MVLRTVTYSEIESFGLRPGHYCLFAGVLKLFTYIFWKNVPQVCYDACSMTLSSLRYKGSIC